MNDEYTPTTSEMRDSFVDFQVDYSNQPLTPEDAEARFDRWLSATRAAAIEDALSDLRKTSIVTLAGSGGAYEWFKKREESE